MPHAYIALGANVGDPLSALRGALRELAPLGWVVAVSPLYRTAPVGPVEQPEFLNAAVVLDTRLAPEDLLAELHGIEELYGRRRDVPMGPRTLDLDLIAYEGEERAGGDVELPHPRAHGREFVLRPLADVAPDLVLGGRTVREWLAGLPPQGVRRLDDGLA